MQTVYFRDWHSFNKYLVESVNYLSIEMELPHKKGDDAQVEMRCDGVQEIDNGVCLSAAMVGKIFIEGDLVQAKVSDQGYGLCFISLKVAGQQPYYFFAGVGEDEDVC